MGDGNGSSGGQSTARRSGTCVPTVALESRGAGRSQHQSVSAFFGVQQFLIAHDALWLGYVNLASAVVLLLSPQLYRFGDLLPPVMFFDGLHRQHGGRMGAGGRDRLPASIAERLKNRRTTSHQAGQRHHPDRTGLLPRRPVHRPGRTRRSARSGEDQDER
jgi:hypothetical protein